MSLAPLDRSAIDLQRFQPAWLDTPAANPAGEAQEPPLQPLVSGRSFEEIFGPPSPRIMSRVNEAATATPVDVQLASAAGASRPTRVNLLPGVAAQVIGVSNSRINGGAFLLNPTTPGGSPKLFLSGTLARTVIEEMQASTNPASALAGKLAGQITRIPNNTGLGLVASFDLPKLLKGDVAGAMEVGLGGVSASPDGNGALFYNGRYGVGSGAVSGNVGVMVNAGGAASNAMQLLGRALLGAAGGLELGSAGALTPEAGAMAVIGRALESVGAGTSAFGAATGTKVWYGLGFRGDVTPGSPLQYEVSTANREPMRVDLSGLYQTLLSRFGKAH